MFDNTHTKSCLSRAVISAVENLRDSCTTFEFRIAMQEGRALSEADTYLNEMEGICRCHVAATRQVKESYELYGASRAQQLCEAYLENGTFSPELYIELVRWSEGRSTTCEHPGVFSNSDGPDATEYCPSCDRSIPNHQL